MKKRIKLPKKQLGEKNACYVFITCSQPSLEGTMEVEMDYEGDIDLAAYLIDSAQTFFREATEEA